MLRTGAFYPLLRGEPQAKVFTRAQETWLDHLSVGYGESRRVGSALTALGEAAQKLHKVWHSQLLSRGGFHSKSIAISPSCFPGRSFGL